MQPNVLSAMRHRGQEIDGDFLIILWKLGNGDRVEKLGGNHKERQIAWCTWS